MSNPNNSLRGWLPTLAVIAGALVLYLGSALIAAGLTGSAVIGALVSNAVIFTAGVLWLRSGKHRTAVSEPQRSPQVRRPGFWARAAAALLLCWLAGQAAALWLYGITGSSNFDGHTETKALAPAVLVLALVLVLAPMGEEMLMRGLAYSRLRRHVSPFAAAVLTTGVFSLLHLNIVQLVLTLPLGILLAAVYEQTGRLGAVIGLHMVFNLLSVIVPAAAVAGFASLPFVLVSWSVTAVLLVGLFRRAGISSGKERSAGAGVPGDGKEPAVAG